MGMRRGGKMNPRFIQITGVGDTLYALDSHGIVWLRVRGKWVKLEHRGKEAGND